MPGQINKQLDYSDRNDFEREEDTIDENVMNSSDSEPIHNDTGENEEDHFEN